MTKFRLSSHDLEIEKGRYGTNSKPAKDRSYKTCNQGKVEDEFHFNTVSVLCRRQTDFDGTHPSKF